MAVVGGLSPGCPLRAGGPHVTHASRTLRSVGSHGSTLPDFIDSPHSLSSWAKRLLRECEAAAQSKDPFTRVQCLRTPKGVSTTVAGCAGRTP